MAKGQHLSRYQQGIVKRYYEHLDTLTVQKLQETLSDLYLAKPGKAADKLWQRSHELLVKAGADPAKVEHAVASGSVEKLAAIVNEVCSPRK
ncbi:MAG: hypothetical protein KF745_00420 [Phycisphaeraceae bacterium]|nr:hypothetical protein [Phycisphaeraceae bacterium]